MRKSSSTFDAVNCKRVLTDERNVYWVGLLQLSLGGNDGNSLPSKIHDGMVAIKYMKPLAFCCHNSTVSCAVYSLQICLPMRQKHRWRASRCHVIAFDATISLLKPLIWVWRLRKPRWLNFVTRWDLSESPNIPQSHVGFHQYLQARHEKETHRCDVCHCRCFWSNVAFSWHCTTFLHNDDVISSGYTASETDVAVARTLDMRENLLCMQMREFAKKTAAIKAVIDLVKSKPDF